ncbi:glycoside hydrolase [Cohnella zeiphila]|uniref:Endo-beta-1,6-galactanase-like domain-containing protein n=1 Tax=Cohnella zeiphila TaxID=2761120 RepID=A0A7X0SSB7_9BACL|nr:glycoside hydrolase [Cohnella zeiphila]MBB6734204.1 hypothetical protein [Cohnella zeiphila]
MTEKTTNRYSLDLGRTYQTIDHFGASGAWSMDPIGKMWSEESKTRVADLLFSQEKGIGLSGWRFAIGSGGGEGNPDYPEPLLWRGHSDTFKPTSHLPYDWSTHEGQRWFLKAAKLRGVDRIVAMAYSPPRWLAKNGRIAPDESVGQSNLADDRIGEFACYLADIVRHFAEEEIPFDVISPVNEPSWCWDDSRQEGNRYTNEQIKLLVRALHGELRRRNLPTEIDIAETAEIAALLDDEDVQAFDPRLSFYKGHGNEAKHGGKYREYIKDFLGDSDFALMIGNKLSYHSYWADHANDGDRLLAYRERLRQALDRHAPAAKLWETEYCNLNADGAVRDLGMGLALFTARVIHHDLTVARASAWSWWLALSPHDFKDGLIYTDFARRGDPETVLPSKTLWALGHYSRFVRPGAARVELAGPSDKDGLMASAYAHPANRTLTVVLLNYAEQAADVDLAGEPGWPDEMTGYLTSDREGDDLRSFGAVRPSEPLAVPGRSIVTLHGSLPEGAGFSL